MVIPNYIRSKMHLCASHACQAAKYDIEVVNWLEKHGVNVESISDGDGTSLEELMYGNDVTDELCHRIEEMEGGGVMFDSRHYQWIYNDFSTQIKIFKAQKETFDFMTQLGKDVCEASRSIKSVDTLRAQLVRIELNCLSIYYYKIANEIGEHWVEVH